MRVRLFLCAVTTVLLAFTTPVLSADYEFNDGITVSFEQLPEHWQISKEPPAFLLNEHASHVTPAQLAAARKSGIETAEGVALKMLKGNDLFIYNPQTGAHLEIDFSSLREGESPPSAGSLKASANYAAEGLEDEPGIEGAKSKVGKTRIAGTEVAYRVDANFLKRGKATRFIGVITFAHNHWIYLYFTGPQSGLEDLDVLNNVLASFSIVRKN